MSTQDDNEIARLNAVIVELQANHAEETARARAKLAVLNRALDIERDSIKNAIKAGQYGERIVGRERVIEAIDLAVAEHDPDRDGEIRESALNGIHTIVSLAIQSVLANDCCADDDEDVEVLESRCVEDARRYLTGLGVTAAEMDAAGIKTTPTMADNPEAVR